MHFFQFYYDLVLLRFNSHFYFYFIFSLDILFVGFNLALAN